MGTLAPVWVLIYMPSLPTSGRLCIEGELGSLEEVVKEFLGKGFLTPVMLHEMWGIADKAYEAVARGAAQADRQALPAS